MTSIEDTYQLSPMQQAMLLNYLLDPKTEVYVQQNVGDLQEELDIPLFRKSWKQIIMRHSALRTSFRWDGLEEPLQDVHCDVELSFEQQDWRMLSPSEQQIKFDEYLAFDRQRGFDLTRAPLLRLALFRLGDLHYRLLWTHHHIILDGRSRYEILKEVFAVYESHLQNLDAQLVPPKQYRSYIDSIRRQDDPQAEIFWRNYLKDFTAPTPIDVLSKAVPLYRTENGHGEQRIQLSESITRSLNEIADQNGFTISTLIQGMWSLLLSRYTGEEDVLFGVVRAGRPKESDTVGLFIYTIPVRVRVSLDQNLIQWLRTLREQQIKMREYERTPLVSILGWSNIPKGTPLFESDLVFEEYDLNERLQTNGKSWKSRNFRLFEVSAFPLTLYGTGGAELVLRISYEKNRFDDFIIRQILGHLRTLLEGIAEDPNKPIFVLPLLTQRERDQLLNKWNATQVAYPKETCIHQQFEAQVEHTPETIAVTFGGKELTYSELNRRANQVAHYLRKLGVGPDVLVGVFMERSLEMVISLYGILKAGGAYVPLDPEYPPDRINFMLEDAQPPVILTQEHLSTRLPEYPGRIICLDSQWEIMSGENNENPLSVTIPENLAYVIYTSGSTGKPKGAMNHHRGISNRLLWMQDTFHLAEAERVLQKTPFSFDVSVWEFFWPLLVGARLVIAKPGGHKDSAYLIQVIAEQNITTIHFVPSMLQIFLDSHDIAKCASLKRVICSGEALSHELQERFFNCLDAGLYNLYGPTEAAVDVTYWECRRDSPLKIVPIGRPIANTRLYILDGYMQPVPIGVAGELYIGGVQVARGYLNRPELTADRFIPDPFSDDLNARLYKTGDSVRFLPDANIEYLGRLDFQVKIRGFRIELGEIEKTLAQNSSVHEAVVVAREDVPGDKRLVAYVVLEVQSQSTASELREYLKGKLPEYMIPASVVFLDALPLNSNGKVDRRNLPVPEKERQLDAVYAAPRKELEKAIAEIWQELLQLDRVGIDDSFFELGGHSLLVMRMHSRLTQITNKVIPITDLFKYPTIRTLAQYLSQDSVKNEKAQASKMLDQTQMRKDALARQRQLRQKKIG